MSILQNRCAPFAPFGAAAMLLAVCYIVFWTGWMEPPEPSPLLPALLAATWFLSRSRWRRRSASSWRGAAAADAKPALEG